MRSLRAGEDYEEIGFAGEIMAEIRSETSIASTEEGVFTPVLRNRGRFRRTWETSSPSSTDSGVDESTPLATVFARAIAAEPEPAECETAKPQQSLYHGVWDAISDVSDYSLPDLGSVAGLALYTDDGSSGPDKDEHASEQDQLPKPISVSKRVSRRKSKKSEAKSTGSSRSFAQHAVMPPPQTAEAEVQTDLTFDCNEEIILVPLKPADLQKESGGIDDYVDTVTEYEDTASEFEADDIPAL